MFHKPIDDRLSDWALFRRSLETSPTPLEDIWEFWKEAPYIPYNHKIDPFNQKSWPTPWDIIVENKYDDFTKALMIGWSLLLTKRFETSKVEIKTLVNDQKTCYYNVVCVNDDVVINYSDNGPVSIKDVPVSFFIENLIELKSRW
jgi:hypothetical protein